MFHRADLIVAALIFLLGLMAFRLEQKRLPAELAYAAALGAPPPPARLEVRHAK